MCGTHIDNALLVVLTEASSPNEDVFVDRVLNCVHCCSFMNAMDTMVQSNSVILYAGGAFLLAFVCSVLGKFNALEQRVSSVHKV